MSKVTIYTDGACEPNPGIGGWCAIIQYTVHGQLIDKTITGSQLDTTNNRMEMMAVLEGLRSLKRPCDVTVYTDSRYVQNGVGNWLHSKPTLKGWMVGWEQNGWRRKDGKLLNIDLWKLLYAQALRHTSIKMRYVAGHSGHEYNEQCDQLAVQARLLLSETSHE